MGAKATEPVPECAMFACVLDEGARFSWRTVPTYCGGKLSFIRICQEMDDEADLCDFIDQNDHENSGVKYVLNIVDNI